MSCIPTLISCYYHYYGNQVLHSKICIKLHYPKRVGSTINLSLISGLYCMRRIYIGYVGRTLNVFLCTPPPKPAYSATLISIVYYLTEMEPPCTPNIISILGIRASTTRPQTNIYFNVTQSPCMAGNNNNNFKRSDVLSVQYTNCTVQSTSCTCR